MQFAGKMTQARKDKQLSRSQLAELIGTSAASVSRYGHGEMKPSIEVATRVAEVLDVSLDYRAGIASVAVRDKKMMSRLEGIATML
ncbi:helix-turn-helix domain-containing protein [Neolewinella sp.]|uniref:helix-turn-helix domain-containing protein n=1 Tax=Neolewinella sp. TaxID=2993543 RepID=UPI003B5216D0